MEEYDYTNEPITRRSYLFLKALEIGADIIVALEAVSTLALEHPEWDMNVKKTLTEWELGSGE